MTKVIEVKNLRKEYDGFGLKDVSFDLSKGYIMGFIGPNGAGKTTTIKLIMNLISKDSGNIKVFGMDNQKNQIKIREQIGFVYDGNYFYDELTLDEMKRFVARFYRNWDDKAFYKYIKEFNLPLNKRTKELSKGMKMKFSLALALSHNPRLIIMDEPTSGLDPIFRSEMLEILSEVMQDENRSIFFSTHITTDLDKIADYITFINDGKIIFSKSKDEILESYRIVKGSNKLIDEENSKAFISIKRNKYGFEGLTDNISKVYKEFKNNIMVEKPNLEDIMLYTVKGGN